MAPALPPMAIASSAMPAGWTLARSDGSASISGPGPLVLDGLTVTPRAGAKPGDSWRLDPVGGAIGLALRPIGPGPAGGRRSLCQRCQRRPTRAMPGCSPRPDASAAGFAGAPPLRDHRHRFAGGIGTADISDPAPAPCSPPWRSTAASSPAPASASRSAGRPAAGDSFRLPPPAPGSSDNGNARALAWCATPAAAGGTLETSLDASLAGVASRLAETDRLAETALAVRDDSARAARCGVGGRSQPGSRRTDAVAGRLSRQCAGDRRGARHARHAARRSRDDRGQHPRRPCCRRGTADRPQPRRRLRAGTDRHRQAHHRARR